MIDPVYTDKEIEAILAIIAQADTTRPGFRKNSDLFAIRQFLQEFPGIAKLIFNSRLNALILQVMGEGYFPVKSIYFDKPEHSNWFVAYHQDLTIAVSRKLEIEGFTNWTVKHEQFAVQPPLQILEHNFTLRIHLDDTDENNGALRVIPASHLKGLYRPETIDWNREAETVCPVAKGGMMFMKPLLLHASGRTLNHRRRRVIHLEFSNCSLPDGLEWSEQRN